MRFRITVLLCLAVTALNATAQSSQLPSLGDRTSGLVSLEEERKLGQEFLRAIRAQAPLIDDPLLQEYIELLTYDLALHSELQDRRLDLVILDADSINAFAAPGGIIGVHDGLFVHAQTKDEIAAIMSHELAHLSQRHYARQGEAGRQASLPSLAGMLAGVLLIAAGGGEAGMAAITAGQAASQSQMLQYSRGREAEADRVGIRTLVKAGMDPKAMAYMFERLSRATRFQGTNIPEFLRTHPVTKDRIADSYNQAAQYPSHEPSLDLDYQLMRARVRVFTARTPEEAVTTMRAESEDPNPVRRIAGQYGLALALTRTSQLDRAAWQLQSLRKEYPDKIAFMIAEAEMLERGERYEEADELLKRALAITPNNYPLTMTRADLLLKMGKPEVAESLLVPLSAKRPNDVSVWYLLAETYGLANNIIGVHEARAEYFVLVGNLDQAITQLGYAIPLVDNFQRKARIRTRIEEIHELRRDARRRS